MEPPNKTQRMFEKGKPTKMRGNHPKVHPKKLDSSSKTIPSESNNNGNPSSVTEHSKVSQSKVIYPQPPQMQQRVLLPEPSLTTEQLHILNQTMTQVMNETKIMKNQMETEQKFSELRAENRELRQQQQQTQMMAQLMFRQQQQPMNSAPPAIIVNVTPAPSRSTSSISRRVTSAMEKVLSIANGRSAGIQAIMEPIHASNGPKLFEPGRMQRVASTFDDRDKLEDITDESAEVIEDGPDGDSAVDQVYPTQLLGNQNEDRSEQEDENRGLPRFGDGPERDDSNQLQEEGEDGKRVGETFSTWKRRALTLSVDSVRDEGDISSISGRLMRRKVSKGTDEHTESFTIDVHPDAADPEENLASHTEYQRHSTRYQAFQTPDFQHSSIIEQHSVHHRPTEYKPYFVDGRLRES